jgi:hypothetical protein
VSAVHRVLAFNGLRHKALVDNTAQDDDAAAVPSLAVYMKNRSLMGKYGVSPSEIVYVVDIQTYIDSLTMTEFKTLDTFGPQATVLTGQLGAVAGVPVIVSEQMPATADTGLVHATAGNNDHGNILSYNTTQFWQGTRRDLMIESERDIQKGQLVIVASYRHAFTGRNTASSDTAVAISTNVDRP